MKNRKIEKSTKLKVIQECYEQPYAKKFNQIKHKINSQKDTKLTQEEIKKNLNTPITSKAQAQVVSLVNFIKYQMRN